MPTGLLDPTALTAKSNTGPASRSVTDDELSSNRLASMTGKDSVMRQRAEAYGKNYATSRGLLDSSIGAQATFGSFVDRATPFAMQEADRYGQVEDQNLAYQNQFKLADKNFGYQGLLQKDNQTWQTGEREDSQNFTAGENALDRTLQKDLQTGEFAWRSGEAGLDRQQQSTMLDRQQSFAAGENALDRALTREELESRERISVEQSKAELERLGYALQLDQMQLNASTQNQMQMLLLSQIMQIQSDGNLNPAAREVAIQNAMEAVKNMSDALANANKTPVTTPTTPFDSNRAINIMVDEATKMGYTNPNSAEMNMALEYARTNNLTEQQMRAYVREKLTPQPSGSGSSGGTNNTGGSGGSNNSGSSGSSSGSSNNTPQPTQPSQPSSSGPSTQDLINLAAQYGYNATAAEAADVAAYAAANGLDPHEVVMNEMRARGLVP